MPLPLFYSSCPHHQQHTQGPVFTALCVFRLSAQMLMQLKNLALEAETELERQDEALDAIASSTDHATTHIDKHTRRMRKLL